MVDPIHPGPRFEARSTGDRVVAPTREVDPLRWGSRFVEVRTRNGPVYREVPLTWEDLFDPQEGDLMVHGTLHGQIIRVVGTMLQHHLESQGRTDVLVCDDVKMLWKDPSVPRVGPDIAVIPDVEDPQRPRDSFDERKEGTGPVFVLEVISKSTSSFDYGEKPGIYRKAGVGECFIVDPRERPWKLEGRRLSQETRRYRKILPDQRGRVFSKTTGLYFSIAADGERLILEDAVTDERLRNFSEEATARKAAELDASREAAARREEAAARREAERRAEQAERRAAELEARLGRQNDERH